MRWLSLCPFVFSFRFSLDYSILIAYHVFYISRLLFWDLMLSFGMFTFLFSFPCIYISISLNNSFQKLKKRTWTCSSILWVQSGFITVSFSDVCAEILLFKGNECITSPLFIFLTNSSVRLTLNCPKSGARHPPKFVWCVQRHTWTNPRKVNQPSITRF